MRASSSAKGEGFGQVVVAAGLEAVHAVVDRAERREDQHRRAIAALAQCRDDREAVEIRAAADPRRSRRTGRDWPYPGRRGRPDCARRCSRSRAIP
jgi:hypothetical protein